MGDVSEMQPSLAVLDFVGWLFFKCFNHLFSPGFHPLLDIGLHFLYILILHVNVNFANLFMLTSLIHAKNKTFATNKKV